MKRSLILACFVGMPFMLISGAGCSLLPTRESAALAPSAEPEGAAAPSMERGPASMEQTKGSTQGSALDAEAHFSMAQAASAEGNTDQAIAEYQIVLMYDPDSALVHARLATEYVKKGLLSEALEMSKKAVEKDPQFIDARLILAGLYSATHDTENALREYDRILKADPKQDEAAVYKSQLLLEEGRSKEALATLEGFVKGSPDSPLAHYYLGRVAQQMDLFDRAVKAYQQAMEVRPGFVQAGLALGYLFEEKKKTKEAISVYQALFDEGRDVTAANRLATIYLKSENYAKALPYLDAIYSLDPEDLNSQVKLGLVQMELKMLKEAMTTFERILQVNPEADRVRYYLGNIHEQTGNANAAIEQFSQVTPDSKLYSDAVLHVAMQMKTLNKLSEARQYVSAAISKSPQVPALYVFSASLDEEAKDLKSAQKTLEAAVQRFPEDEKTRYYLGTILDRTGDPDGAMAQMEALLLINDKNVDALNYIGYAYTARGIRLNDAERALTKALSLKPANPYVRDSWGWYLFVRGRVKEAVVQLKEAVRMKPDEAIILEHLGDAYAKANLRENALHQYEAALKHAEDSSHKEKLQAKRDNLIREITGR